jgi:ankyrin repeat protein
LKLKWLSACRRGSYATVQSGIREGWAPVNACDAVGYTALMRCCVSGQMLELLLGCSAVDVNATGAPDGTTPLMLAARYRTARTVEALLRAGARGGRDARGSSELHKAAANPNESVLQLMLTHACPIKPNCWP